MFRLAFLFIVWPIVELYLLIRLGQVTSAGTAIAVVIVTGLVGAALARREGLKTWYRMQESLRAGRLPGDHMIDALLILVAGAVLITPGLITDVIGILLLVPPTRRIVRSQLKRRFRHRFTITGFGQPPRRPDDDFIDVEVREADRSPLDRDKPQ